MVGIILNSGNGSRMEEMTKNTPKCLLKIKGEETILKRQIDSLLNNDVKEIYITTGKFHENIKEYTKKLYKNENIKFIYNDRYNDTNYIYSMYLLKDIIKSDVILMHGDLVYDKNIINKILNKNLSNIVVIKKKNDENSKDFRAIIENNRIKNISVTINNKNLLLMPLYKIDMDFFKCWMNQITEDVENGIVKCYAEDSLNTYLNQLTLNPFYIENIVCDEVDNKEDYKKIIEKFN